MKVEALTELQRSKLKEVFSALPCRGIFTFPVSKSASFLLAAYPNEAWVLGITPDSIFDAIDYWCEADELITFHATTKNGKKTYIYSPSRRKEVAAAMEEDGLKPSCLRPTNTIDPNHIPVSELTGKATAVILDPQAAIDEGYDIERVLELLDMHRKTRFTYEAPTGIKIAYTGDKAMFIERVNEERIRERSKYFNSDLAAIREANEGAPVLDSSKVPLVEEEARCERSKQQIYNELMVYGIQNEEEYTVALDSYEFIKDATLNSPKYWELHRLKTLIKGYEVKNKGITKLMVGPFLADVEVREPGKKKYIVTEEEQREKLKQEEMLMGLLVEYMLTSSPGETEVKFMLQTYGEHTVVRAYAFATKKVSETLTGQKYQEAKDRLSVIGDLIDNVVEELRLEEDKKKYRKILENGIGNDEEYKFAVAKLSTTPIPAKGTDKFYDFQRMQSLIDFYNSRKVFGTGNECVPANVAMDFANAESMIVFQGVSAVDGCIQILKECSNSLSFPEILEALNTYYPKLAAQMFPLTQSIIDVLNEDLPEEDELMINFSTKDEPFAEIRTYKTKKVVHRTEVKLETKEQIVTTNNLDRKLYNEFIRNIAAKGLTY